MAEYLGEGSSPLRGGKPSRKQVDFRSRHTAPTTERSRNRKPEQRQQNSLRRFLRDFKGGLSSLGDAIERLLQYRKLSGGTKLSERHTTIEREKIRNVMVPHVLEREILTGQQAVTQAPFREHSKRLTNDYRDNTRRAVASGIPQFMAAMLQAEAVSAPRRAPTEALRPVRGGAVEALMKVAKSVKAGRLPFVPKETRKRAQELLDAIYGRRTGRPATWRDKEVARIIEKHRLIPLAAQTQPSSTPQYQNFTMAATGVPLVPPLPHHKEPKQATLTETEARKLEAAGIPRFRAEGMADGPKLIDAGESTMHTNDQTVVYRDNSTHVSQPEKELSPARASIRPASAVTAKYRSPIPTTRAVAAAPTNPEHKHPKPDASKNTTSSTRGGLGSHTGGGTLGAGGGQMKVQGELRIPELDNAIAEIKGFMTSG